VPTLLLTGCTGFAGSVLQTYFLRNGWQVIALVREMTDDPIINTRYLLFDLENPVMPEINEPIDAFIHLAYVKQEKGKDAYQINVKGTEVLLRFAAERKIPANLFLSSLSASADALSQYGKQKYDLEAKFLKQNGIVIRAGLILGDGGLFASMRNYLKKSHRVPVFGNGDQPIQTVHVDDLAKAIYITITKKLFGRYIVAEDDPAPYREFYTLLCAVQGVKPEFIRIPFWLAEFALGFANLIGKKLPITKDNLLGLKQMKRIPSTEDLKKLGIELRGLNNSLKTY
jgi:nucleoside-diphosphate-sugar epimerase